MASRYDNSIRRLAPLLGKLTALLVLGTVAVWCISSSTVAKTATTETGPAVVPDPKLTGEKIEYINPDVPDFKLPLPEGESYEATVPDTLDLAERCRLAINAATGMLNPNIDYQLYFAVHHMADPPGMRHSGASDLNTVGKFLEVLPLLRTASGSRQGIEAETALLRNTLLDQGEDGMLYLPVKGRPEVLPPTYDPNGGWPGRNSGDITQIGHIGYGNCRSLGALLIYAKLDPKGPWKEAARQLNEAFKRTIIVDGDLAYNFKPWMTPGEKIVRPATPPRQINGGMSAWVIRYLAMYDRAFGDPEGADLALRMVNYNMGPLNYFADNGKFLNDVTTDMSTGGPCAHFHSHAMNILAALDVASKTGDKKLLDKALKAYEWGKTPAAQGSNLIGYFPEVIFKKPGYINSEICEVSDMICAAILLSRMGIDRWDDADRWTRNMLAEAQMTDTEWRTDGHIDPKEYAKMEMPENRYTTDRVMERTVGSFSGWPAVNDWVGRAHNDKSITIMACCTGSGDRALYCVWNNILDFDKNTLRLNLLLNRASKWADVDSYIPYEGRVEIKVKQHLEGLDLRIPEWVEPNDVKVTIGGKERKLTFDGRYAKVGDVQKGETAVMTFPIFERTVNEHIQGTDYTFVVRGNEVVSVDPPGKYRPFYQRDHYRAGQPRYRKVNRFVAEENFDWW